MTEYTTESLVISFILTWLIGLAPPVIIRFIIVRKPLGMFLASLISFVFLIFNVILFELMGSQSKTHGALMMVAMVAFFILRKSKDNQNNVTSDDFTDRLRIANTKTQNKSSEQPSECAQEADRTSSITNQIDLDNYTSKKNSEVWNDVTPQALDDEQPSVESDGEEDNESQINKNIVRSIFIIVLIIIASLFGKFIGKTSTEVVIGANDTVDSDFIYESLKSVSDDINSNCPMVIDANTTLVTTQMRNRTMNYYYVLSGSAITQDRSTLVAHLRKSITNYYCSDPIMATYLEYKIPVNYVYMDKDRVHLFQVPVSYQDCKKKDRTKY